MKTLSMKIFVEDFVKPLVIGLASIGAAWTVPELIQVTELLKNVMTIIAVFVTITYTVIKIYLSLTRNEDNPR